MKAVYVDHKKFVMSIRGLLPTLLFGTLLFGTFSWGANVGDVIKNTANATYTVNGTTKSAVSNEVDVRVTAQEQSNIWVEKSVDKSLVGIGELVRYTIKVHNAGATAASNVTLYDLLPLGVKYEAGTFKVNGMSVTPTLSIDGTELSTTISTIASQGQVEITFIAVIGAGIGTKEAVNQAWAINSSLVKSNIATASLMVKEELFRSTGTIIGQVYDAPYKNDKKGHGIAGVRLYLEDGTYVITDKDGKYHLEGIKAGTHTVQVDEDLLPRGYAMAQCQENARFGNRAFSQFVDLGQGALKRADFCLKKTDMNATNNTQEVKESKNPKPYEISKTEEKMPIYNESDLQINKTEILWPPLNYVPSIPSTKIAVRYPKTDKAEVWLNGARVSMLNYDGKNSSPNQNMAIDIYRGVDLLNGENKIEIRLYDISGKVHDILKREIYVANTPAKILYMPKLSNPVADGINPCIIAVKFLDSANKPLRQGMMGSFSVNAPYRSMSSIEEFKNNPLATQQSTNAYTVGPDGIAYIALQPTTQTGEATLSFKLEYKEDNIKVWLKPSMRKWIMVGFAEGSVGYNTLKKHQESLHDTKEGVVQEGQISFFAKGSIKANWLLTMAYDTSRDTKNSRYFGTIDPNTYYTIYNDDTTQAYDAASRKKLYIKLENDEFNILFGDFNTDLSATKLTQYTRTFTGVKSEYNSEHLEAKTFAAYTDQVFQRDEFRGDGTSGYYYLKSKPVITNSEKISIEVRDRYRNEIIVSTKELQRFRDYDIDYNLGRLYFKEPVYSVDENFNPIYIVAQYEIDGDGSKHLTYGGRGAVKLNDGNVEVGSTYVSEDMGTQKNEMMGADTTVKLGADTTLKAEYAKSKTNKDGEVIRGDAKLAEIEHLSNGLYTRGYYREQDNSFGLGQLSNDLSGTRKIGMDAVKTFDNRANLKVTAYRDTDTLTDKNHDVAESRLQIDETLWSAYFGYRYADASDTDAVNQILLGGSYSLLNQRLKLLVSHDRSLGANEDVMFPTKTILGIDYALNPSADIFGSYEWGQNDNRDYNAGRVGTRVTPWSGMTVENTTLSESKNDTTRLYNTTGLLQSYQVTPNIWVSGGYENGVLLDGNATKQNDKFDAYRVGGAYRNDLFSAILNGEYRNGTFDNKQNVSFGVYTQPNDDLGLAASSLYNYEYDDVNSTKNIDTRLALAYRPQQTDWTVLNKLEYINTDEKRDIENKTQKLINNIQANYNPTDAFELSLQYGIKYVFDSLDDYDHKGWVHLGGIDARYDLTKKIDIGFQTSALFAQSAGNFDYGAGVYVGYNLIDTMWLSLGYNWDGLGDNDFDLQTYRTEGPYVKFRMRFDQKTLGETAKALSW
ncbi:MAG: hypothetical protein PHE73_00530 [Sulfurovaceae bacterium]|nr:hypothetical protein [Sulfurovaceae bacterium]